MSRATSSCGLHVLADGSEGKGHEERCWLAPWRSRLLRSLLLHFSHWLRSAAPALTRLRRNPGLHIASLEPLDSLPAARGGPPPSDTRSPKCDPRSSQARAAALESRCPCIPDRSRGRAHRWSAAFQAAARTRQYIAMRSRRRLGLNMSTRSADSGPQSRWPGVRLGAVSRYQPEARSERGRSPNDGKVHQYYALARSELQIRRRLRFP